MILDGKKVRDEVFASLKEKVKGLDLKLVVIQVGHDEASNVYIKQKEKMCSELGYHFGHINLDENVTEEEIKDLIIKLNNDDNVTGILVQMPLPKHINEEKIANLIDYKKDVDGLTYENVIHLYNNTKGLMSCTPKGIINILDYYNISVIDKKVLIIGRGILVGRPLSMIFRNMDANVTCVHSKTTNLEYYTKEADIIICATGKAHLLKKGMIKKGAVVIDAGITRENGKIIGDADYKELLEDASYITPVPGGIGPMTIAGLAENVLEAYYLQKK